MDLGEFHVVRRLANGTLGPTYLALEKDSSQQVVLKLISQKEMHAPDTFDRLSGLLKVFSRQPEYDGLIGIRHVAKQADGSALLSMPYLGGKDITSLVARHPGEPSPESLWIARDVAELLRAGHLRGVQHLALRPTQVLVSPSEKEKRGNKVQLVGMGLYRALGREQDVREENDYPAYVAPEQMERGHSDLIGEWTDVYGVAVLLLHLLLGQQPTREIIQRCQTDAAQILVGRRLSLEAGRLLEAMLAHDPRKRPSLAEVLRVLGQEINSTEQNDTVVAAVSPKIERTPTVGEGQLATSENTRKDELVTGPTAKNEGRLFGNYRVIRQLGAGGMGIVYEAEHRQIGRRAAVKVLHPEFAENTDYAKRFLNEARSVNIIRHPGLVEIFEYGQQPDGTLYIVMEFLQGESLGSRLRKRGTPYPLAQILGWAHQIARAMTAAHEKGIVHRDLKPENIMLVQDPVRTDQDWVKILDFGIAKVSKQGTGEGTTSHAQTGVGTSMGTPIYMAPEQYGNAEIVDGRADVFAFGVMLYEMLAGKLPYTGNSMTLLLSPAPPIEQVNPAVPKKLGLLVRRMMAGPPVERPTMDEVRAQLASLVKSYDNKKHSSAFLVAGLALVAFVSIIGYFGYQKYRTLSLPEARTLALSVIQESLSANEIETRLYAASALGKSRDISYLPVVKPLLSEKQPLIVAAAARCLGDISAIEAQFDLSALLDGNLDNKVKLEAATALAKLSSPKGIEGLRSLLQRADDVTRLEAALRLTESGDRSGISLLRRITEADRALVDRNVPVLAALAKVGDASARQRLTERFESPAQSGDNPIVAFSLARLGDATAFSKLKRLAADPGPSQLLAARLLSSLGDPAGYPLLLTTSLDEKQPEQAREIALDGLADSKRVDAALAVVQMLKANGTSKRFRLSVAATILQLAAGEAGMQASRSLTWARAALGSDSSSTREIAVTLLGDLELPDSVSPLRQALKDQEREVRKGAARALGRKNIHAALEALADALDDSEGDVRSVGMQSIRQVVAALRKRGERDSDAVVTRRLQQLVLHGSDADRIVAGGTLLYMGDTSQRNSVSEGLHSSNPMVRRFAIELIDPDEQLIAEGLRAPNKTTRPGI